VASWSQPFFLFAALDVVLWQLVALTDLDIATGIAASNALLLAILVFVWRDVTLAYGALSVALLAISLVLRPESLTIGTLSQFTGQLTAIALGAYLLAWAIDILDVFRALPRRVAIWLSPTIHVAMVLAAACVLISWQSLQTIFTAQSTTPATAATWGFAGAVFLAHAYRRRTVVLGYVAVALMQGAWFILLISQSISQPQAYAIPAGLYLVGIGVLERRRHPRPFSCYIELLGLAILLVTAFIQSLDPASGFPYFMLLLVESVLIIWWSTVRRVKLPFFVGIGAAFITIFAQLILLATVNDVARWIVLFGMGLLLVGGAVFVERRWAKLSEQVDEWRSSMAGWQM
jgi:hypothetical protein